MTYQVPFSSSPNGPPSTPDRKSTNIFSFGDNPSTTPAGPPPSSAGSFTPAGPPPSSMFGSSMMGTSSPIKPLSFSQQSSFGQKSTSSAGFSRPYGAPQRSGLSNEYQTSPQSVHSSDGEDEDEDNSIDEDGPDRYPGGPEYSEEDADGDAMSEVDVQYEDDEDDSPLPQRLQPAGWPGATEVGHSSRQSTYSDLSPSRRGFSQSRDGDIMDLHDSISQSHLQPKTSRFEKIAKDLYTRMPAPTLDEPDDIILSTEIAMTKLYEEGMGSAEDDELLEAALATIPNELTNIWARYSDQIKIYDSEEYAATLGPGERAPDFAKANFLASLILQIENPPRVPKSFDQRTKPLPQTLLEWMDEYHNLYPTQFGEVQAHRPSPSNHRLYWDTIFNGILRGKVEGVINLLRDGGWQHARNESDDPRVQYAQAGFAGAALSNIEKVVNAALQVLTACPASHGDWNIRSSDWTLFRLRVSQASEHLRTFAEGKNRDLDISTSGGSPGRSGNYSTTAKKAESKVPWYIYQNLMTLYAIIMGDKDAVIENAQDWCEATVGLLVWWDEGKDDRRLALGRSQSVYRAASREADKIAFRRKLRRSFEFATADSTDLEVNSADEIEVGLASVFEGNNEAVIGFLRGWSGPVSSAVAEVASLSGWLAPAKEKSLINLGGLDEDDMEVLGLNSSPSKADGVKDLTLIAYARSLSKRGTLTTSSRSGLPHITREGWELAISIMGRLDSIPRSEEMVEDFLRSFHLDSSITVNKLWRLLNDMGMDRQAENIAESYADSLAEASHKYGEALYYYALAHREQKVKDVLDLLISFSLIQSTAYPSEAELDEYLKALVSSPKDALTEISHMDTAAAELLYKLLSGYATLRKFYDLRDEAVLQPNGKKISVARKMEAAEALIAVITSSDDNIRGGLYDEGRGAVVSVDFLLALLGEAMVFVNQTNYTISVPQIDVLLKAIEDLQTVGPRVYTACTEFLQTVIASGQGLKGSTPHDLLRKSTSGLSGTSGSFSLVGSSMMASQLKQSMSSSGVMVKGNIKRGWDWRKGITANTKGEDVLRILRLGLSKDLAKAWLVEADGNM